MNTTQYVFEKVSVKVTKHWTDADGRKRRRTAEFMQTINPFNTNADGTRKTREQIMVEIRADADAWLNGPPPDEVFG